MANDARYERINGRKILFLFCLGEFTIRDKQDVRLKEGQLIDFFEPRLFIQLTEMSQITDLFICGFLFILRKFENIFYEVW